MNNHEVAEKLAKKIWNEAFIEYKNREFEIMRVSAAIESALDQARIEVARTMRDKIVSTLNNHKRNPTDCYDGCFGPCTEAIQDINPEDL